MKHILLVEDNREISQNIQEYLELEGYKVTCAYDGEQGIEKALGDDYDLILLDLMLPEVDGVSIARKVSQKRQIPIIMITAKESLHDRLTGFEVGAVDYLVKPFDLAELLARVQVHIKYTQTDSGTGGVEKGMIIAGVEIDLKKRKFIKDGEDKHLTQKEFLILEKLMHGKDQVISRSDIIEHLWGGDGLFDGDNKLDVYISNIRSKLGKNLIKTVKGVGYTLGE